MPLTGYVAIYGGSFNPPHAGHQIACMWLIEALNVYKIVVAPTYQHYFGKELIDFNHRVTMCELMVKRFGNRAFAVPVERSLPKPNTTLELVKIIQQYYPNNPIAVVIGTDLIPSLHKWHSWDEVVRLAKIVAVGRTGFNKVYSPYDIYQYPIELSAVSSTAIRNRIEEGEDITGMLPSSIKEYIERHNLYAQTDCGTRES